MGKFIVTILMLALFGCGDPVYAARVEEQLYFDDWNGF